MTIQDLRKRMDIMNYLGFDERKKIWVYMYQDMYHRNRMVGLVAGKLKVIELSSLSGLHLSKA